MKDFSEGIYSPLNIDILLWCRTHVEPYPRLEATAVSDTIKQFLEMKVIEPDIESPPGVYKTTPLGTAWVEALCNVPPPTLVFMDQFGRVLEKRP